MYKGLAMSNAFKKLFLNGLAVSILIILSVVFYNFITDVVPHQKIIRFIAPHGPYEAILKPLYHFKSEVENKTENRIKVEIIIPESSDALNLLRNREAFYGVQNGKYQMAHIFTHYLKNIEKDFLALDVPFLFKNYDHTYTVIDGEIGQSLLNSLELRSQFKGLGFSFGGGYRIINSKTKKLTRLSDLKNLRIDAGSPVSMAIFDALGAQSYTRLQKIKTREMIKNGSLDALATVYSRLILNEDYKIAPIINELFFNMQLSVIVINKKFFYSLSDVDQKIVRSAVLSASNLERRITTDLAAELNKNHKKYNIKIVNFLPKEKEKIIRKLRLIDWEQKFELTPGLLEKIKTTSVAQKN